MRKSRQAEGSGLTKIFSCILGALLIASASCVKLPRATRFPDVRGATLAAPVGSLIAQRVNINTASPAELEKLPGIGRALAARIVEHRREFGRFRRAEHLMMVRGISARRYQAMRALVSAE